MMSRHIATCLAIYHTHRITSKHQAQIRIRRKPTTLLRSTLVFFGFVSALILAVFVWPFLSFFCCPSAGHIIGLTVSPANSNLVPSGLGLLPERMHVCFCFIFHFFLFCSFSCLFSFLISGINTWYSLQKLWGTWHIIVNVVGHFMLSMWCFVVERRYGPTRVTDTRNVLLKCRHSMLSMIRYDAAAGHVVLVECHLYSFSSGCFQWFGLTAVVVVHWSCEFFFWPK